MEHFSWVTATDIAQWANRLDARAVLPQVVRRLIHGTIKQVLRIGLPAGEGVQLGGYDGVVRVVDGNAFVPAGQSVWEMGANKNIKGKADGDYNKRKENPGEIDPKTTTYIFVTPRRWGNKDEWARARTAEEVWAEVRAYDADGLEQWLELCPSTRAWLTRLIKPWTEGIRGLEEAWQEWSNRTTPPLSSDLILCGRGGLVAQLQDWLRGPPSAMTICADSAFEALLIATATILTLDAADRATLLARSALVSDSAAWRQLAASDEPLFLIPNPGIDVAPPLATAHGHHVLVPIGPNDLAGPNKIELQRPSSVDVVAALRRMGLSDETAEHLAREAKGRLSVLLRLLGPTSAVVLPPWAVPAEGPKLKPVLLAGGWNTACEEDCTIVARLARRSHDEVLDTAVRWLQESDSPLFRTGNDWRWVSREDGWNLLRRYLTTQDLDAFGEVFLDVLSTPDPRFDLPPEERWLASVRGKRPSFSNVLRQGLAETAALIATRDKGLQDATRGADRAAVLIRKLLAERPDWRVWCSLSNLLPDLAEAAPDEFLDAVEDAVLRNDEVFRALFQEETTGILGTSAHPGLLWALERLAWSPEYLSRVVQLLGRLAARDPGGRLANRPLNSLREILLNWHPQTNASLDQRLEAIDALATATADVAWRLCLKLLPQFGGDHAHPTCRPQWRKWSDGWTGTISDAEYWRGAEAVANRLLSWVGQNAARWAELMEGIGNVPERQRDEIVRRLEEVPGYGWSPSERGRLWQSLRGILHRHRQFSDAKWALPGHLVERIAVVYNAIEPTDATDRYSWLFSFNPELPNLTSRDYDAARAALEAQCREAILTMLQQGGVEFLVGFASHVENPHSLGVTAASVQVEEELAIDLLGKTLSASDRRLMLMGRGYVCARFRKEGWPWVEAFFRNGPGFRWIESERAQFACGLPFDSRTWDLVASWGNDTSRAYWAIVESRFVENPKDDTERAVRELLATGRPYAALDVASMSLHGGATTSTISAELLMALLEAAVTSDPRKETPTRAGNDIAHHVQTLLDAIDTSEGLDEPRVARLEWQWLPILRHGPRGPKTLQRALGHDPDLFAKIVSLVYRSETDEERAASEDDVARARYGWELLRDWEQVPGLRDDGSMDETWLNDWIDKARTACAASGHCKVGDDQIGEVLAYCPDGADGAWPHEAVRNVIERLASRAIEGGFYIGIMNKRGMVGKSPYEGGTQERGLAERFGHFATAIAGRWPTTAKVLRRVAESYLSDAKREDIEAEQREYLWG